MSKISKGDRLVITTTQPNVVRFPLHSHPEWEFLYYRRGNGALETEKGTYPFSPGSFILVPPFLLHGSFSDNGFEDVCITLEGFHPVNGTTDVICGNDESGRLHLLCDAAADLFLSSDDEVRALAYDVTVSLLRLAEITFTKKKDSHPARPVKDAIDRDYTYPDFDLTEVIQKTGYVPNYVRDTFKRDYGESPLDYLTNLRIRYACRLLSHFGSTLTVSEVAYRSGFTDPFYFSRVFHKRTGVSPREYRKTERTNPNG